MYTRVCEHTHTRRSGYEETTMHVLTRTYTHTHTRVSTDTDASLHVHTHTQTHTSLHAHAGTHTYIQNRSFDVAVKDYTE